LYLKVSALRIISSASVYGPKRATRLILLPVTVNCVAEKFSGRLHGKDGTMITKGRYLVTGWN
jgi:hypothetical protein